MPSSKDIFAGAGRHRPARGRRGSRKAHPVRAGSAFLRKPTENLAPTNLSCAVASSCRMQPAATNDEAACAVPARDRSYSELRRGLCGARRLAFRGRGVRDGPNFARQNWSKPRRSRRKRWRSIPRRPAPTACWPSSTCTKDGTISRWGRSTARSRSIPAMWTVIKHGEMFLCGRASGGGLAVARRRAPPRPRPYPDSSEPMLDVLFSRPLSRRRRGR